MSYEIWQREIGEIWQGRYADRPKIFGVAVGTPSIEDKPCAGPTGSRRPAQLFQGRSE